MADDDNGLAAFAGAVAELDRVNTHIVALRGLGRAHPAVGAENVWLGQAIRLAVAPAPTREAAQVKISLLTSNLYGWAILASNANGLDGAPGLIMGAVNAEGHDWGIAVPKAWEDCDVKEHLHLPPLIIVALDDDIESAYRKAAARRRLGPALRRFEELEAEVAERAARGEKGELAEAIGRSRQALLDAMAVPARDLAELERKQRGFIAHIKLPEEDCWYFENAVSVSFMLEFKRLGLTAAEVKRFKSAFSNVWTSNDRPARPKGRA